MHDYTVYTIFIKTLQLETKTLNEILYQQLISIRNKRCLLMT